MTKILNLDDLETEVEKKLVLKGVTHLFKPLSVDEFIKAIKDAEAKDKARKEALQDESFSETVEFMVEQISRAFPTIAQSDLRELPVGNLRLINNFVNDVIDADIKDATPEEVKPAGEAEGK